MPFPKTWIEELSLEWLQLQGFAAQSNLPIATAKAGGRFEADILGGRVKKDTLEIIHIETGQLAGGENSTKSVRKKFSVDITESITQLFRAMFSFAGDKVKHQKLYIATFATGPVIRDISALGIEVQTVQQFVSDKVLRDIAAWKSDPPHRPQTRGSLITLPESYWLLQMLDHFDKKGLIKRI
jgi:hypothetical protein